MPPRLAPQETLDSINDLIRKIEESGRMDVARIIERWRQSVVYEIANSGKLDALSADVLKNKLHSINDAIGKDLIGKLTDNQKRLFVKGIQVVDKYLESGKLNLAAPYLSEHKLDMLKSYSADLVTGIMDDAKKRIGTEISMGALGQKSREDIISAIGNNLDDSSVFGTIARRAQVIYQTETKRVQNIATNDRLKQASTQIHDLRKRWLHSHIGIPRPYHLLMDRKTIPVNEPFILRGADGITYEIMEPHDPILPAGETINCRCVISPVVLRFEEGST
jgi:hypothetical protein